jgi:hypothetical protein
VLLLLVRNVLRRLELLIPFGEAPIFGCWVAHIVDGNYRCMLASAVDIV